MKPSKAKTICMYGNQSGDHNCYFCQYFSTLNSKCAYEYIKAKLKKEAVNTCIDTETPHKNDNLSDSIITNNKAVIHNYSMYNALKQ